MKLVDRPNKVFFIAVGLLALWVGFWGLFVPTEIDRAIPWLIPPLHARFVGSLYASATVLLAGGLLSKYMAEVRVMIWIITIWTGMLIIISFFHLSEFDYTHKPVWFWFGAYIIYPPAGLWLIRRDSLEMEEVTGAAVPQWVKQYFMVQGILFTALALLLLFTPEFMVSLWPWKITPLLAQIYSGPFIAYGVGSLLLSRRQKWMEVRLTALGTFTATFGTLIASLIHRDLLPFANPSTWIWFSGFTIIAVTLAIISVRAVREGRIT